MAHYVGEPDKIDCADELESRTLDIYSLASLKLKRCLPRLVGIPFLDGGRDWNGCDCWGIVRLCMYECCEIELPSYGEISASELNRIADRVSNESSKEPWHPLTTGIRLFDVVVMHRKKAPVHIGIVAALNPIRILHTERATQSVFVPVTHPTIKFRYANYFRHRRMLGA